MKSVTPFYSTVYNKTEAKYTVNLPAEGTTVP